MNNLISYYDELESILKITLDYRLPKELRLLAYKSLLEKLRIYRKNRLK